MTVTQTEVEPLKRALGQKDPQCLPERLLRHERDMETQSREVSGTDMDQKGNREQFNRLMAEVTAKNPSFCHIPVHETDPLCGWDREWRYCIQRMKANGIQDISVESESSPPSNPDLQWEQMVDLAEFLGFQSLEDHVDPDEEEDKPRR